jgi:hypothetical protein
MIVSPTAREQFLHLVDLELDLVVRENLTIFSPGLVNFAEVGRELEAVDTSTVISNDDDGLIVVEANMCELGSLNHLLLAKWLVLVLCQVKDVNLNRERERGGGSDDCKRDVLAAKSQMKENKWPADKSTHLAVTGDCSENSRRIRRPSDITDSISEIKREN